MRIGIVSKWFNRGQPVVGRQLRSAVDELGHESFVLARPKRDRGPRPGALDRDGVWDQPGVTEASAFEIPDDEYLRWADENSIDAAMFDNHYQFEEIAALRAAGVRTIGRFVWEHFSEEHVEPAQRGVRRHLLDDARRARALPRHGHRRVPASSGAATPR